MKLINVVGARPNFMKIAPIIAALTRYNNSSNKKIEHLLVHTGQHYDEAMSKLFFDDLGIPKPEIDLEVGSATHAVQTAEIMRKFEEVCLENKPTHVLVVGDVNSTIACALVATKLGIKVIHVEAGLRSFDRTMPEEINRILTDSISDYLFITEKSGEDNLINEGVSKDKIFIVGNVMIDTMLKHREKAKSSKLLVKFGLKSNTNSNEAKGYCTLTLHRPSNVDDRETFTGIMDAVHNISQSLPVIFPVHLRTRKKIAEFRMENYFNNAGNGKITKPGIYCIDPIGYLDFLSLTSNSKLVLTDSGGIQEETTVLGVPCVTIRENTERPVTVTDGTNVIAGTKKENIIESSRTFLEGGGDKRDKKIPPLWDGNAAGRIIKILADKEA